MQPPFVASKVPSQMVAEIDLDELAGAGFPETSATLCWGRTADSIARRRAYNIVEMTHQIWLLAVCDLVIGTAEYPAS